MYIKISSINFSNDKLFDANVIISVATSDKNKHIDGIQIILPYGLILRLMYVSNELIPRRIAIIKLRMLRIK